jgi:hypothetical protein
MQERGRFFLIILNLATIEVIMHLEEQTLDEIMNNSELLGRRGQVYLWSQPSSVPYFGFESGSKNVLCGPNSVIMSLNSDAG